MNCKPSILFVNWYRRLFAYLHICKKLYVAGHTGDDFNPNYYKGQSKASKEVRLAEAKQAKRAKLDPSQEAEAPTQTKKRFKGDTQ
jgi:hypothetical protein